MATLADLIEGGKQLSDKADDPQVSNETWVNWVNDEIKELHRIVRTAFADTFFETLAFTLAANTHVYTLPDDFLAIKGLTFRPNTTNAVTIRRFNYAERNDYVPAVDVGGPYELDYIPAPTLLVDDADELQVELEPWDEYIKIGIAIKALVKEESDTSDLVERRNLMRQDIESSVNNDEAEADSIADVADGIGWPYNRRRSFEADRRYRVVSRTTLIIR